MSIFTPSAAKWVTLTKGCEYIKSQARLLTRQWLFHLEMWRL